MDDVHEINITQTGNRVNAKYLEVRKCDPVYGMDPPPGVGSPKPSTWDFTASADWGKGILEGQMNTCVWSTEDVKTTGWVPAPLVLRIEHGGDELNGQYYSELYNNWINVTIVRKTAARRRACEWLETAYESADRELDWFTNQLDAQASAYNEQYRKLQELDLQSKPLKDEALSEWDNLDDLAIYDLTASMDSEVLANVLLKVNAAEPIDPIAKYIWAGPVETAEGIEVPPVALIVEGADKVIDRVGEPTIDFVLRQRPPIQDAVTFFQSQRINFTGTRELLNEWRYSPLARVDVLDQFLNILQEMDDVVAGMSGLLDQYDKLLVEWRKRKKVADEAGTNWENCLKRNP